MPRLHQASTTARTRPAPATDWYEPTKTSSPSVVCRYVLVTLGDALRYCKTGIYVTQRLTGLVLRGLVSRIQAPRIDRETPDKERHDESALGFRRFQQIPPGEHSLGVRRGSQVKVQSVFCAAPGDTVRRHAVVGDERWRIAKTGAPIASVFNFLRARVRCAVADETTLPHTSSAQTPVDGVDAAGTGRLVSYRMGLR